MSRVSCSSRTIAVIMPNTQGIRNDSVGEFLTTVDAVEALTGYDLFSNLPEPIQRCVEAGTTATIRRSTQTPMASPTTTDNCPSTANPDQADSRPRRHRRRVRRAGDRDDHGDGLLGAL